MIDLSNKPFTLKSFKVLFLFDSVLSPGNTLLGIHQFCLGDKSEIIGYLFNATNIKTFDARNNYETEISKRS